MSIILFKSDLFTVEPGEEIQPGIYGLRLAKWLEAKLKERGYAVEWITEDWGWCLVLRRKPFMLWVGCSNVYDERWKEDDIPESDELTWQCFAVAEGGWIASILGRINKDEAIKELESVLMEIILSEPRIRLV